jgi:hypothetical protein
VRRYWLWTHSRDGFGVRLVRETRRAGIYRWLIDVTGAIGYWLPGAPIMRLTWRLQAWLARRADVNTTVVLTLPLPRDTAEKLMAEDDAPMFEMLCRVEDSLDAEEGAMQ